MNETYLVLVDGLCVDDLVHEFWLAGGLPAPTAAAELVHPFPATPAAVEATLHGGRRSAEHGVVHERDPRPADLPRWPFLEDPNTAPSRTRWTRLGQARRRGDAGQHALHELAGLLAGLHDRLVQEAGTDARLFVAGGPALRPAARQVVWPGTDPMEDGDLPPVEIDGAIAWMAGGRDGVPPSPPSEASIRRLLRTPGVERVLPPPVLQRLGAPADRGWAVLAEPGASFTGDRRDHGHFAPPHGTAEAVLLLWCRCPPPVWPAAVHSWRIAPTLALAEGRPMETGWDRPLALLDAAGTPLSPDRP